MDCSCNCFGVATAARVPVKRYNLLVPDVFPVIEPPFDRPLGITIERKIKKLAEYLDKNEHRAPKVSRRLQRRLYAELAAGRYGYVKLAAQTYSQLLLSGRPEKSHLLANELVVRTVVKRRSLPFGSQHYLAFREPHLGSAVGLLLSHAAPAVRKLGVDLLIDFIKQQQTSDYVPQLEAFVPLLCASAAPHATVASATTPNSAAAVAAAAAAAAEAAEQWDALRAASLRALLEHLRFCARLSYVSYHLHTITFAVLACVEASGQAAPKGHYMSPRAALADAPPALASLDALTRGSIGHAVGASPPDVAALLVFEELAHMTRDAAEGKKVLQFVMRFLDQQGRWLGTPVAQTSVAVLRQACEQEHQRYLLFSSLLRHVSAAEQLTPAERAAVLQLALGESRQLEQGLAAPALLLALRELPAVIASNAGPGAVPPMPTSALVAPVALATLVGANGSSGGASQAATAGAAAPVPARHQEIELPKLPPLSKRTLGAAAGAPVNLQPQILAAVQQLAVQVEDSGQLVEAVGSTIARLRGSAPISTAALQCCVAAAQALICASPRVRGGVTAPRTFPSLLLQELAGIMACWEPHQRLLAHQLLLQLLPAAADGLKEQQASSLLSAVWHEAALASNQPAVFVGMDCTLRGMLGAAPVAALPQVLAMLGALQQEVLLAGDGTSSGSNGGGSRRLAALTAAQCCALLCLCSSVLRALAVQLGQAAVAQLAVPGCEGALKQLGMAKPHGLLLPSLAGSANGGVASSNAGAAASLAAQQHFWQGEAVGLMFGAEEQQAAAAFLASWRQASTPAQQQERWAAAMHAVPLFRQQGGGGAGGGGLTFQAIPAAALMPRLMQNAGGGFANGSHTSAGEGASKRAQRLRSVYKHVRQISLCDGDRAMLASISQESAAEEPQPAALQLASLLGLNGGGSAGGGGMANGGVEAPAKTVDDVLAEVDAALAAAEQAVKRGRSPSPPASWRSSPAASPAGATATAATAAAAAGGW